MPNGNGKRITHIMYGAGLQIALKFVDEAVWSYGQKSGQGNIAPSWYTSVPFIGLVPLDDWIFDIVLPLAIGVYGKLAKSKTAIDFAIGAGIAGLATFLHSWFTQPHPSWLPFSAKGTFVAEATSTGPNTYAKQVTNNPRGVNAEKETLYSYGILPSSVSEASYPTFGGLIIGEQPTSEIPESMPPSSIQMAVTNQPLLLV